MGSRECGDGDDSTVIMQLAKEDQGWGQLQKSFAITMPATATNMAQKAIVQTFQASFATETLGNMCIIFIRI